MTATLLRSRAVHRASGKGGKCLRSSVARLLTKRPPVMRVCSSFHLPCPAGSGDVIRPENAARSGQKYLSLLRIGGADAIRPGSVTLSP